MITVEQIRCEVGGRWANAPAISGGKDSDVAGATRSVDVRVESLMSMSCDSMALLSTAGERDIAFFFSKAYAKDLATTRAGVIVTGEAFVPSLEMAGLPLWKNSIVIACADPYVGMAKVSRLFAAMRPESHLRGSDLPSVHASAQVSPQARIGKGCVIGANCVIEENAEIGDSTVLMAGTYVGRGVKIGKESRVFPRVTIYDQVTIGVRARIHAGAVIGADGFGYAQEIDPTTKRPVSHVKIYHFGSVKIGDDVEIGANACIDRGTIGDTLVGNQCKLDNLTQIAHNVTLGQGVIVCGKTAFAGSASAGDFVFVGGLTGVSNQVHIGSYAKVGPLTLVTRDVPEYGEVIGSPQREVNTHFRLHATLNKMVNKMAKKSGAKKE